MRQKRRRVWTSLTAAATLVPAAAAALTVSDTGMLQDKAATSSKVPSLPLMLMAGGEGGEGGAGGEGGVDTGRAGEDPVVFLTALDVIAAHYHAGLAAYLDGDHTAGAEMFAHPIGEVYVDLAPVAAKLGAADFGPSMQKASDIALAGVGDAEVQAAVQTVLDSIAATASKAPKTSMSQDQVEAAVLADMLNRAALQYDQALKVESNEPFLDGFGFLAAARARAAGVVDRLKASDPDAEKAVTRALDALAAAYPSINRPKSPGIGSGEAIAATSRAMLVLTAR